MKHNKLKDMEDSDCGFTESWDATPELNLIPMKPEDIKHSVQDSIELVTKMFLESVGEEQTSDGNNNR